MFIRKYELPTSVNFYIEMPNVITPLCIHVREGEPYLHVVVNPDDNGVRYKFWCIAPGEKLPNELTKRNSTTPKYIGIVFQTSRRLQITGVYRFEMVRLEV